MKTGQQRITRWLTLCALCALLPMQLLAWQPNAEDVQQAVKSGDFTTYAANLTRWLNAKSPSDPDAVSADSLKALFGDPTFIKALAQRQFIAKVGEANLATLAQDSANQGFLTFVLESTEALNNCLEAATPIEIGQRKDNSWGYPVQALQLWKKIYDNDPDSKTGVPLKLAIAIGLNPPGTSSPGAGQAVTPADPIARYHHFKSAYQNGELAINFADNSAGEYRFVVNSNASDEDLAWGRKMVNTWRPDLRKGELVVNTTSEVWRRNSPVPFDNSYKNVLAGGGKCGPRSSWSVFICQAFGLPCIGVGQPAHACAAYKSPTPDVEPQRGALWKVVYGRGWGASRPGWGFFEGATLRTNLPEFMRVEHMRWLTTALTSEPVRSKIAAMGDAITESARLASRAAPQINTSGFVGAPDSIVREKEFASPVDSGEDFGARMRGFVFPPTTGEYRFALASDDDSDLFLSIDESPDNKRLVASVRGWTPVRDFKDFAGATAVPLEAGKKYYIEAVHREVDGGDHVAAGWTGPGVDAGVIQGMYLSPYPSGAKGGIDREIWQKLSARMQKDEPKQPAPKQEAPIAVPAGVIHVEAETYAAMEAIQVLDCYEGGQQVNFGKSIDNSWVEYVVDVPTAGTYALTLRTAAVNFEQVFRVSVGANAGEPVTINVPNSNGLWATTEPAALTLAQGAQTLRIAAPNQRGIALRWLELKAN